MAQQTDHIGDTNKMVNMKLYTEEQVRKAIAIGYDWCHLKNIPSDFLIDTFIDELKPIELPNEDEIIEYSLHYSEMQEDVSDKLGKYLVKAVHMDGANWMLSKIKGGGE